MKEYAVYRTPVGTILLDYNNTLWTAGYPYFPKSCCTLIESGVCEGGPGIGKFYAELKKKYDIDTTKEVMKAGKLMKIELCDHIIVGTDGYYSFRAGNLI